MSEEGLSDSQLKFRSGDGLVVEELQEDGFCSQSTRPLIELSVHSELKKEGLKYKKLVPAAS